MLVRDASGRPAPYHDEPGVIALRKRQQAQLAMRKGQQVSIPEDGICRKCKRQIYAYSPAQPVFSMKLFIHCPWCHKLTC